MLYMFTRKEKLQNQCPEPLLSIIIVIFTMEFLFLKVNYGKKYNKLKNVIYLLKKGKK